MGGSTAAAAASDTPLATPLAGWAGGASHRRVQAWPRSRPKEPLPAQKSGGGVRAAGAVQGSHDPRQGGLPPRPTGPPEPPQPRPNTRDGGAQAHFASPPANFASDLKCVFSDDNFEHPWRWVGAAHCGPLNSVPMVGLCRLATRVMRWSTTRLLYRWGQGLSQEGVFATPTTRTLIGSLLDRSVPAFISFKRKNQV